MASQLGSDHPDTTWFIGFVLPAHVQEGIMRWMHAEFPPRLGQAASDQDAGVHWQRSGNLHITLRFLGRVGKEAAVEEFSRVAAAVARLRDAGRAVAFASGPSDLVVAGVRSLRLLTDDNGARAHSYRALTSVLGTKDAVPDSWQAHITVARLALAREHADAVRVWADERRHGMPVEEWAFDVDRVTLLASIPGANAYEHFETVPLRR